MNKYFATLFFLLLFAFSSTYGQNRRAVRSNHHWQRLSATTQNEKDPQLRFRVEADTVSPDIFADDCSNNLVGFYSDEWGYVGGTNNYEDLEKAQKLNYNPDKGFLVREIWGWFGLAQAVGDGYLVAKAYTLDAQTGAPGDLMAISRPRKTSELLVPGEEALPTVFQIQNPVTITDDAFFASIDFSQLYAAEDTVFLLQTEDGCGLGSDAWELYIDGIWSDIKTSWDLNTNFALAAVVEPTDLIQERLEAPIFKEECSNYLGGYLSDEWGYVSGTNNYGDREKAQKLDILTDAPLFVREVWGWFSEVQTVNDGPVSAKVYSVNETSGSPGALLGTSASVKTSELNFAPGLAIPTSFSFTEPVAINDISFFASIDISQLYATADTVALWQTDDECGDGSTSWELYDDGVTWNNLVSSWGLNANWFISAIVEFTTDTDDQLAFVAQNGLHLFPAFPNPAAETVRLKYQLERPEQVQIEVYAAEGRLLRTLDQGLQMSGEHIAEINVKDLPAGAYVYGIVTGQARLMSRFVVSR